jgi:predicted amidohydrolase
MTAPSDLALAVAQFAPTADRAENLLVIRDLATRAAARGARLVAFPEYSSYFHPQLSAETVRAAEALDGEFVAGLAGIAKVLGVHLVAGMIEAIEGSEVCFNTVVAIGPEGAVVAKYRKIHLYDAFGQSESEFIRPGEIDAPEVFDLGGLSIALQTCYDLRFPEMTRRLVDAGADVVLIPSEWVRGPQKEHHWRTLVTARAIENTVYVAAPDQAPPVGAGNSMIVDPMGVEIATVGEGTDVALAWVSKARIDAVRLTNPALALRRFTVTAR